MRSKEEIADIFKSKERVEGFTLGGKVEAKLIDDNGNIKEERIVYF